MRFEEWWMDQEYDPQLYGLLSEVWSAAQAEQREADAKICGEMGALDAMEQEEHGSAAMVRVADRQSELCAAAIRRCSSE